jgi:hypothetical protein
MAHACYACGCSISSDMFNHKILHISWCPEHYYLHDDTVSLRKLAIICSENALACMGVTLPGREE